MTHPFRTGVEAKEVDAKVAAPPPAGVLRSRVAFSPFEGRDAATAALRIVVEE